MNHEDVEGNAADFTTLETKPFLFYQLSTVLCLRSCH